MSFITDATGQVIGRREIDTNGVVRVFDSNGIYKGYSDSSGTYDAVGVKKFEGSHPDLLIGR